MKISIVILSLLFVASLMKNVSNTEVVKSPTSYSKNGPSLMAIIQSILDDPEFLALNTHQQLKILVTIYDMLERHLKTHHNN